MNFFGKSKNASAASTATSIDSSAVSASLPHPSPPPSLPSADTPNPATTDPSLPAAPPPEPPVDDSAKKSRFARFKKPQLPTLRVPGSRKPSGPDPSEVTTAVADIHLSAPAAPPVDPAKAKRRAARRAERTRREEEWAEKDRQRRNQAGYTGLPMDPLDPLPDFDSASEDESRPDAVAGHAPPPDAVLAEGVSATTARSTMAGPYMPANPDRYEDNLDPPMVVSNAPPAQMFPGQAPSPVQVQQQPPRRDPAADAQMAEMFGAQAYVGSAGYHHQPAAPPPQMAPPAYGGEGLLPQAHASLPQHGQTGLPRPAVNPAPIGWGDVYNVPSQPMFGAPMHSAGSMRGALDIDPHLADRIRRGRELARLAIEQEERGNLGAAENGYMKALELLVPVSKELDVGSELDKTVRMTQKGKIQREAAAMLDRCEEIRLFLKANGPAVPNEMPSNPSVRSSPPGKASRTAAAKPKKDSSLRPPDQDANVSTFTPTKSPTAELSRPKPVEPKTSEQAPPNRPPPPPPPTFDGDSGDLLDRIASRRNVLSAASAGIQAAGGAPVSSGAKPSVGGGVAKCFVCNAPANLKAKCDHTFCTKCGNQAANVFGTCPDRSCNAPLTSGGFESIL